MGQETILCPSGLKITIRNMKAKELSLLAAGGEDTGDDKASKKRSKNVVTNPVDPVLAACTVGVEDPGPYGSPFSWKNALVADRFFTLLQIRICTWGEGFEFRVRCKDPECKHNKKPFLWEENLNGLEIKNLPAESIAKVKARDLTFELQLGGKQAKFQLQTGVEDGRQLPEVPKHKMLLAQVASRLTFVAGVDVTNWEGLLDWVGELDLPDLLMARDYMESVDGGVQTNTVVECPNCGLEFDLEIPFGARSFLLPERKTTASSPGSTSTSSSPA